MSKKPGRKPENRLPRGKQQLSCDARFIYALHKKQPQTKEELCKSADLNIRAFYRISNLLKKQNIIKCSDGGWYSFSDFVNEEKQIADALMKALDERWIVSFEIMEAKLGRPWREIESLIRKVAKELEVDIVKMDNRSVFRRKDYLTYPKYQK
jgi:hypothetical protein